MVICQEQVMNSETAESASGVSEKQKIVGFSVLRALACIAVIILHVVYSAVLLYGTSITRSENIISLSVVNNMMWAVPCFIMVTGALLLDPAKKITYKKLYSRYIFRVFAALVLFSVLFRVFDIIMDGETLQAESLVTGVYELFTGTGWSHLWYLYLLIGLYLLLPFYRKIAAHSSAGELRYLLGMYVLFLSLLPVLQIWDISCGFYIHVLTIYPFYLFAGYCLRAGVLPVSRISGAVLAAAGTLGITMFTVLRWIYDIPELEQLWGYSSIFVIMQAVGIFALLYTMKNTGSVRRGPGRIFLWIDKGSFGIYLIHMLFVRLFMRYMNFNPYTSGGILGFAGIILLVFFCSCLVTWILKKIPYINKIL